ncbi:MAG: decaprenyl-phosphate phosphoribosyltransferase [Patescibacteria group bacterium]|nr:decaprenyl-phosphate phosphoribosyltransferase [Patescibacteria group bacterium]MCL5095243.1 decaprenyl-phosphate phosphoribosyltransferase [Patescibacteria group bacterium]
MVKFFIGLVKTARPRQWLKNIAVFAAIIFTGQLFNPSLFKITVLTFFIFCAASSANYLFNDVLDASKDRKHPFKKNRPVASGVVPAGAALLAAGFLIVFSLLMANLINSAFFVVVFFFLILEFSYTLFFKQLAVIDILAITSAYILRVYGGEVATGFHISVWLFLTVLSLSLFLAIGKRRAELTLIQGYEGVFPKDTRTTLSHYSEKLLDTYIAMTAASTWITYTFFTFLERPPVLGWFWQSQWGRFSSPLPERKWLMLTIPFVLFGMMRYIQLIYEGKGESPERVLTSDIPLIATVLGWGLVVIAVIYGFGG